MVNLKRETDQATFAAGLKYKLYLAEDTQADFDNFPKATTGKITASPLKTGEKFHYLEAESNSVTVAVGAGNSPRNGIVTITAQIGGLTGANLQYVYDNAGKHFVAVIERCSDGKKFLAGSPCSGGLQMSYTNIGDNDGKAGIALQLQGADCPDPLWEFEVSNFDDLVAADSAA